MHIKRATSRFGTFLLGLYLVTLNLAALLCLLWVWPIGEREGGNAVALDDEIGYLVIALLGGLLGTSVAVLTSFTTYVGNRMLVASWSWWYVVRPLIGATVGLFVYAAIRGGILKVDQGVDVLNPYTVTVLSAAGGLYSKQLVDWLNEKGEAFLSTSASAESLDSVFQRVEPDDTPPTSEEKQ